MGGGRQANRAQLFASARILQIQLLDHRAVCLWKPVDEAQKIFSRDEHDLAG